MQSAQFAFESTRNERTPCECCGSLQFIPVCFRNDNTLVVHCNNCHLEFVNPLPSIEVMREDYQKQMTGNVKESGYHSEYILERQNRIQSFSKLYNSRMKIIEGFYPDKGQLLDIGCGAGFFLNCAKERGWTCHGLEILPEYVQYAKKNFGLADIRLESIDESLSYAPNSFHVVTLWDLIEHLRHPLDCLKRINRVLKPGGLLIIWTPNAKNSIFLKENWLGYGIHQHLYFFSKDSLNELLKKAGFKIISLKTDKARKGLLNRKGTRPYDNSEKSGNPLERFMRSAKRDLKNTFNPLTYLGPLFDVTGYGFNLFVIASKHKEII